LLLICAIWGGAAFYSFFDREFSEWAHKYFFSLLPAKGEKAIRFTCYRLIIGAIFGMFKSKPPAFQGRGLALSPALRLLGKFAAVGVICYPSTRQKFILSLIFMRLCVSWYANANFSLGLLSFCSDGRDNPLSG
jgi:hypothetical protein